MSLFDGSILLGSQYVYDGKGPFDTKMLVQTYEDLTTAETWLSNDGVSSLAYNGMLVAVWRDSDINNNGIYFLYNGKRNNKDLDVTDENNWHKLASIADLENSLSEIDRRITALEEESDVITYGYRSGFPEKGEPNKLYVAADEGKTYVWFNDNYLPVSGAGSEYEEPEVIYGGSAD